MHYRNHKGPRLSFEQLSPPDQQRAICSFHKINMDYLDRKIKEEDSLNRRINIRFWQKLYKSRALVIRIRDDRKYAIESFRANLTEFTETGEYLNYYLEPVEE